MKPNHMHPLFARLSRLAAVTLVAGTLGCTTSAASERAAPLSATGHEHDWDWLVGSWNVQHHRLKERLTGCTEWEDFTGTSTLRLTMGGLGTLDENVLHLPNGTYQAVGLRAFDPKSATWSVWWLDERSPRVIDPPLYGKVEGATATFEGDDTLRGKAIKVRYRWWDITRTSARWDQAFSPDGGATWETNWVMTLTRAGS
jgi:hypothetical protein